MAQPTRPTVLVVCGKNKRRSRTAEYIFKNDARFHIRSVGLSPKSERKISEKDLLWANLVLVMEPDHRSKIREQFGYVAQSPLVVLHIPDVYEFMDEELIDLLTHKINIALKDEFGLY